jgi:hypothetical protein
MLKPSHDDSFTQAVLLIFDITNSSSFGKLPSWYNAVMGIISQSKGIKPHILVIANKCKGWNGSTHIAEANINNLLCYR